MHRKVNLKITIPHYINYRKINVTSSRETYELDIMNNINNGPTMILSWLYLGDMNDLDNIKKYKYINKVISFAEIHYNNPDCEVILFDDNDCFIHQIFFNKIFEKIFYNKINNNILLINCYHGTSQSPSIIIAYLGLGIIQKNNKIINVFNKVYNYVKHNKLLNNKTNIDISLCYVKWLNELQEKVKFENNNMIINNKDKYYLCEDIISNNDYEMIVNDQSFSNVFSNNYYL